MNSDYIDKLKNLISGNLNKNKVKNYLSKTKDQVILQAFIMNYQNISDYKIYEIIINNPVCDLGTALQIFYLCGGYNYLEDMNTLSNKTKEQYNFIKKLYGKIISGFFKNQNISYTPVISNEKLFVLRNKGIDKVFLEKSSGENVRIPDIKN